jgi:deoxyribonuclease V
MILAIDVHYKQTYAKCVGVLFDWQDEKPQQVIIEKLTNVAEYVPGLFYKRELPCILAVIEKINLQDLEAIIVDGHVFIDNDFGYGLGGHVWEALSHKKPIIGLAKRAFYANEKPMFHCYAVRAKIPFTFQPLGANLKKW